MFSSPDQITVSLQRASVIQIWSRQQLRTRRWQRRRPRWKTLCLELGSLQASAPQGCSNVERGKSWFQPLTLQESSREVSVPMAGPLHKPSREWTGHTVGGGARGSETCWLGGARWLEAAESTASTLASWCQNPPASAALSPSP